MRCDECDKPTGDPIDVWDENSAWLRFCSWVCLNGYGVRRIVDMKRQRLLKAVTR